MAFPVTVPWSDDLLSYDFGPGHPMAPIRLRLTLDLIEALGLWEIPGVCMVGAEVASDEELALVHETDYVAAVRAASTGTPDRARGLGTTDDPIFAGMHEASARIAGATLAAARAVWQDVPRQAVSLAGGMHHAMPGRAGGFCIYNDVAVAIAWLLEHGCERVLYLDVDAHHGDGVERTFWDDPRVVTISIHQSGQTLFPGTGFAQDIGGPNARGSAINLALPEGTGDNAWLRGIEAVTAPVLAEFAPQVIVSQHGCDTHHRDPLTGMDISVDGQRMAAQMVQHWAHRHGGGRWLATGGGGYDVISTVPRSWAHLLAVSAGAHLPVETLVPEGWLRRVRTLTDGEIPVTMSDGRAPQLRSWVDGFDPADPVDQAIAATRRAAFPWRGLDPLTAE
ncbi:acetoin utilization protein AcuC [Ruania halotolerans]|uniref:acetoin utilization protein AcuC n=1 Tax=Ruania halotolerans TaxID=2897773 RepID=UPI001E57F904|nr:acetoin utilization protein AcuC [Ruania halotolerans]UFU05833.1 acetoin utilization protein AcuC [Ruania halotolerans]